MKKPWIITDFLKEMTDGFYIDINSENNMSSPTTILDKNYRWRGMCFTQTPSEFTRGRLCKIIHTDPNNILKNLVDEIYNIHPGTMIHYMYIQSITDLKSLFDAIYEKDVIDPYSKQIVYPHLNIINLEIVGSVDLEMVLQLCNQFDLKFISEQSGSSFFVNEIFSYLL